jgi:anti-sigma regulatory factor (Ser/Thr protein kinase)
VVFARQVDEMLELTLAGGRGAPGLARTALRSLNGSLAGLGHSVRLLVTELVTNAVKHAGTGPDQTVRVRLECSAGRVRGEVIDDGPGFEPRFGRGGDPLEDGFGLTLVDQVADRWGVDVDKSTRVWFEIDRGA